MMLTKFFQIQSIVCCGLNASFAPSIITIIGRLMLELGVLVIKYHYTKHIIIKSVL